jgi:hypothetical protein
MKLAPFTPYMSKPTEESRLAIAKQIMKATDETTDQIIQGLIQIIAKEGPTLSTRAFTHYARKGGMGKLTPVAIRRFTAALKKAIVSGQILMEIDTSAEKTQALLWLPSMERVVLREHGNRGFDDIPASELGEVMFTLVGENSEDKSIVFEKLAELYGLNKLPKGAMARLDLVYEEYVA